MFCLNLFHRPSWCSGATEHRLCFQHSPEQTPPPAQSEGPLNTTEELRRNLEWRDIQRSFEQSIQAMIIAQDACIIARQRILDLPPDQRPPSVETGAETEFRVQWIQARLVSGVFLKAARERNMNEEMVGPVLQPLTAQLEDAGFYLNIGYGANGVLSIVDIMQRDAGVLMRLAESHLREGREREAKELRAVAEYLNGDPQWRFVRFRREFVAHFQNPTHRNSVPMRNPSITSAPPHALLAELQWAWNALPDRETADGAYRALRNDLMEMGVILSRERYPLSEAPVGQRARDSQGWEWRKTGPNAWQTPNQPGLTWSDIQLGRHAPQLLHPSERFTIRILNITGERNAIEEEITETRSLLIILRQSLATLPPVHTATEWRSYGRALLHDLPNRDARFRVTEEAGGILRVHCEQQSLAWKFENGTWKFASGERWRDVRDIVNPSDVGGSQAVARIMNDVGMALYHEQDPHRNERSRIVFNESVALSEEHRLMTAMQRMGFTIEQVPDRIFVHRVHQVAQLISSGHYYREGLIRAYMQQMTTLYVSMNNKQREATFHYMQQTILPLLQARGCRIQRGETFVRGQIQYSFTIEEDGNIPAAAEALLRTGDAMHAYAESCVSLREYIENQGGLETVIKNRTEAARANGGQEDPNDDFSTLESVQLAAERQVLARYYPLWRDWHDTNLPIGRREEARMRARDFRDLLQRILADFGYDFSGGEDQIRFEPLPPRQEGDPPDDQRVPEGWIYQSIRERPTFAIGAVPRWRRIP